MKKHYNPKSNKGIYPLFLFSSPSTYQSLIQYTFLLTFQWGTGGWSAFAVTDYIIKQVGLFDENFFPAYFEDEDYDVRLKVMGFKLKTMDVTIWHGLNGILLNTFLSLSRFLSLCTVLPLSFPLAILTELVLTDAKEYLSGLKVERDDYTKNALPDIRERSYNRGCIFSFFGQLIG